MVRFDSVSAAGLVAAVVMVMGVSPAVAGSAPVHSGSPHVGSAPVHSGSPHVGSAPVHSGSPHVGSVATVATVVGGTGSGAALGVAQSPYYIAISGSRLIASDLTGNVLRSIDLSTGTETVVAGTGYGGFSGDGSPAIEAELNQPAGVAIDSAGDVFVADQSDARIREIAARDTTSYGIAMKAGDIYSVAGNGNVGFSGDGGPAPSAMLGIPQGLAVDGSGNLYFADTLNGRVREIAAAGGVQFGTSMTTGYIYSIAGNGKGGAHGYAGDGGPATGAEIGTPQGVSVDPSGDVFVTQDFGELNSPVRVVAAATKEYFGIQLQQGDIFTVAGGSNVCAGATDTVGDGCHAPDAQLEDPVDAVTDSNGDLYITDYYDNRVREVDAAHGMISTIAGTVSGGFGGNGGPATSAQLAYPTGLALDSAHDIFVSDSSTIREVSASSATIEQVAGNQTFSFSGDGGPGRDAQLGSPTGVGFDTQGDLFVTDAVNNVIREVPAANGTFFGVAMTAGDVYTIAGKGGGVAGIFGAGGLAGDGGPALSALLSDPRGLAVDGDGDVLFVDAGNARVREIAAVSHSQFGIAMTAGDIYTVVGSGEDISNGDGGPASQAGLLYPAGVAIDTQGDLFVTDTGASRLREVPEMSGTRFGIAMTAGDIYTIAGTGAAGYSGDGGPALNAELSVASGVAIDAAGDPVVADTGNNVLREIAATSGTRFGIAMTAGDIYTVAGDGKAGYSGDGGAATAASLNGTTGVGIDRFGNLWVSDTSNHRLREVSGATAGIATVAGNGTAGFSGDGGEASMASMGLPAGIAFDGAGNPYVAEFYDVTTGFAYEDAIGRVVKVTLPSQQAAAPSEPTGVTAEPGRSSLTVRWSPPASDGGSPVQYYTVSAEPGGATKSVDTTLMYLVFGDFTPGTQYTFSVAATNAAGTSPWSPYSATATPIAPPDGKGYSLLFAGGAGCSIVDFGSARLELAVGVPCAGTPSQFVSMATTPDDGGYWAVDAAGDIYGSGDAALYGSMSRVSLVKPIVAMASTPDGEGYWMVASDGGVFTFGDAIFYGSAGNIALNAPIVAMASTPDGYGYWMVASDGGVFTFGDAKFYGSAGNIALNAPIVAMASTPDGDGYWMVASDGGVFTFGDAKFYGSAGNIALNAPIVAMASTPDGDGYWMVASDGGVFTYGDAGFYGSMGGVAPNGPFVAIAAG